MIPLVKTSLPPAEILMPALEKVLYSGYIAQGDAVDEFERKFEAFVGSGHTLALSSGTAALHIALILAGVGAGDEVISSPLTAEPTNVAIKMTGATIRWADVDIETGNISPDAIEQQINSKTKAILVVDYAGISVDVKRIQEISNKYGIPVIEDAAHALGTSFEGKRSGNHFPYTIFSFQAIKHLTTIDGGALQIHDEEKYEQAKLIRWFGLNKKVSRLENNINVQGYKYNMNNVNATIGLIQLESIDQLISTHIRNGRYLDQHVKDISGTTLINYYPDTAASYWLYTLRVENREEFIRKMQAHGVMASELHRRNDLHQFLNDNPQSLPALDTFYEEMVHLPCGWWVSEEDCQQMTQIMKSGW